MEAGNLKLQEVKESISEADLAVNMTLGVVLRVGFGSALALRKLLQEDYNMVYITISSNPLYLVHWNDLSPEKQKQLEKGKQNV